MHSATQIISQRGTPAARTKPRWQPYSSIPSSASLAARSPPSAYLNTPTSVPTPPPTTVTSFSDLNRLRSVASSSGSTVFHIPTQTPKDLQRESSKNKFAAGLVGRSISLIWLESRQRNLHLFYFLDQAVKTLSEVWRPQDIPIVFLPPAATPTLSATAAIKSLSEQQSLGFGTGQLSSPISTSISSTSQISTPTSTPINTASASLVSGNGSDQILPIRSFVHEVLRRSRTSGIVLQTALCYLEAIRPQVPNLLHEERIGIRAYYEPESRILPATEAELAQEAELNMLEISGESKGNDDGMNTVRIANSVDDFDSESKSPEQLAFSTSASLPSPLLCPRRTFLASIILASKFSQDKCYSNRAWAKLSGLPPREIGRCERALGQALEWRLWVGKTLLSSQTPTSCSTPPPLRQIARSQSEGSILIHSSTQVQFLNPENIPGPADIPMSGSHGRGLRKSATLPVDAFVPPRPVASSTKSSCDYGDDQVTNSVPEWKLNSQVITATYSKGHILIIFCSVFKVARSTICLATLAYCCH